MYELNGVMYAGEAIPELKVTGARITNDWMMLITFSNGETRVFDGMRLWGKPVYEPLRDQTIFDDFAVDYGVLTWQQGRIDIGTNNLYDLCYPYDTIDKPPPPPAGGTNSSTKHFYLAVSRFLRLAPVLIEPQRAVASRRRGRNISDDALLESRSGKRRFRRYARFALRAPLRSPRSVFFGE